jgi:tetratricopeptide (TPR) repeat protein
MNRLLILLLITVIPAAAIALPQQPGAQPTMVAKRPPQAKTQAEFSDYNAAYAINGGAAMEKAANEFAAKYPDSELRQYLYSKTMHEYQNENNPTKMLAMGEKVLSLDPDNPIALVLTATILSDGLTDADPDRQQKISAVKKNAAHALQTLDVSFTPPANATAEQIAAYKSTLKSMAYSALGIMELKTGDDPQSERDLKTAADLNKTQPDPYIWYHLALAQDHQKKYAEALTSIDEALRVMGGNADLAKLASGERERLTKLTGVISPAAPSPAPNKSQPPQ